jgi:hypothetical protein
MSFILLGKHADNTFVMLSGEIYESRKDAADALSSLTSDPAFDHWDAEVLVVDINNATPVLLVRPAVATVEAPVSAEMDEGGAEAFRYAGTDAGATEEDTESLVVEDDEVSGAEDEAASSDTDLAAALTELGVGDEGDAEAAEGNEDASLRDAIARTTAQMAASGIVPPDSVGPAGEEAEEAASEDEAVDEGAPEATETPAEDAPVEGAEPDDESQSWPWASASEEAAEGFSLSALEEPGVDEGSLVKAAGDDETMDAARPVIMGDYDEAPVEPMSIAEADAVAQEQEPAADEGGSEALAQALAAAVAEAGALDAEKGETPEAPVTPEGSSADQLSCDDCVYFQTCPNKEDREPASCGSFQWK